jgi:hypothetical protein
MTDLEPGVVVSPDTAAAMERLSAPPPKRTMTEQHSSLLLAYFDIVDNLCARVEALEAPQFRSWHPQGGKGHLKIAVETTYGTSLTPSPAGSLVERVVERIVFGINANQDAEGIALAVLRDIAAWLRTEDDGLLGMGCDFARLLEQEATR